MLKTPYKITAIKISIILKGLYIVLAKQMDLFILVKNSKIWISAAFIIVTASIQPFRR